MFPKNRGTPKSSHFNRVFHYKLSILGYLYFWKHPYICFKTTLKPPVCSWIHGFLPSEILYFHAESLTDRKIKILFWKIPGSTKNMPVSVLVNVDFNSAKDIEKGRVVELFYCIWEATKFHQLLSGKLATFG